MATGDPILISKAVANNASFLLDSDLYGGDPNDTDDAKSASTYVFTQAEAQTTASSTRSVRSGTFIRHEDNDLTNYYTGSTPIRISEGLRVSMTGAYSGGWQSQVKDLHGIFSFVEGRTDTWTARGVMGVGSWGIQHGAGVATNEFHVSNPSNASSQSAQLVGIMGVIHADKGHSSTSAHGYDCVYALNYGSYNVRSAFIASCAGAGTFDTGLNLQYATISAGGFGITMPASTSGNSGSTIQFDTNDILFYDRGSNAFGFTIGGVNQFALTGTTLNLGVNLSVSGDITASGSCCADYVLDKGYPLLGLEELRGYIDEHSQLPDLAVSQAGKISLVKGIDELVVKIEELTLYVLQLHDRLKVLEEK